MRRSPCLSGDARGRETFGGFNSRRLHHFFLRKMKHRGENPSFGGTRHVLGSCWLWRRSLRAAMNHCDGFDAARCQATASRRFFTGVGPTSGLTRLRLIVGPFREADREAR